MIPTSVERLLVATSRWDKLEELDFRGAGVCSTSTTALTFLRLPWNDDVLLSEIMQPLLHLEDVHLTGYRQMIPTQALSRLREHPRMHYLHLDHRDNSMIWTSKHGGGAPLALTSLIIAYDHCVPDLLKDYGEA